MCELPPRLFRLLSLQNQTQQKGSHHFTFFDANPDEGKKKGNARSVATNPSVPGRQQSGEGSDEGEEEEKNRGGRLGGGASNGSKGGSKNKARSSPG